jgi:predicted homoserine dehydrogenase-like protein
MTTVVGEKITAIDMGKVLLINSEKNIKNNGILTNDDLQYQEDRRKRKVRKLNFEER